MGCDIHAYIEYKAKDWYSWDGTYRMNFTRYYGMFTTMAGVRSYGSQVEMFRPRGIPQDISHYTLADYTLYIDDKADEYDPKACTQKDAKRYISLGKSYWGDEQKRVVHPDWHSASWLSLGEFKLAYKRYRDYYVEPKLPDLDALRGKSLDELKKAFDGVDGQNVPVPPIPEVEAIIAYMETLEKYEITTRLVFWFDN